ncbi:unnamed protein product [Linum tenue]|uniref:Cytochrome P450 n=1 Tax=Linum tenue TaxID=586396 RepID=A0AAV0MKY2_9ROSI|nr:unnamed protein product [Linum tenue]
MMDNLTASQMLIPMTLCLGFLGAALIIFLHNMLVKPLLLQRRLNSLGARGPSYKFFFGNTLEMKKLRQASMAKPMSGISHDIYPRLQPHLSAWTKTYGRNFTFWFGSRPFLVLSEPNLVKEVAADREKAYRKVEPKGIMKTMLGDGLVTSGGEKWVKMRKLANHAFNGESLKNMTSAMIASTEMMLERWKNHVGKEIEVYEEFKFLTSEVISRTAFGSNFVEGKRIFNLLSKMVELAAANFFKVRIPGISKIYKSRDDTEAEKLEQGIRAVIQGMLRKREEMVANGEAEDFGSDFCGLLLSSYHETDESKRISEDDLIDECKTVYLAGQETTNTLLSWVMLLLSIHTDWQEKARSEVQTHLGDRAHDADGISKLKTVSMIINETLRLYPPAIGMARRVVKEVQLGKHTLPKNTYFTIDTLTLHQDPEIWGEDALQFNPERFSEGVAKATKNNASAFVPFGIGQRVCAGSNFAAHEAKIALAMILQRYAFTLSPAYVHSPLQIITIRPEHGVQVILHAL